MKRLALTLCLLASPALAAEPDAETGHGVFNALCVVCHGAEARGDGPMAQILTVMPADLTQLSASNGGVFPTFRVVRQIDGRDPLLAHGGEMPLFGEMFDVQDAALADTSGQPILTAQPIADIVTWLMTIQDQASPTSQKN